MITAKIRFSPNFGQTSVMTDDLAAFRDDTADADASRAPVEHRELLLFELDGAMFGVLAREVSNVIPWRAPAPIPHAGPQVLGLVQDAGRIVVVVRHPSASSTAAPAKPTRIVICETRHGLLGLPASNARTVESVAFPSAPAHGELFESSAGASVYVEPERLGQSLVAPSPA